MSQSDAGGAVARERPAACEEAGRLRTLDGFRLAARDAAGSSRWHRPAAVAAGTTSHKLRQHPGPPMAAPGPRDRSRDNGASWHDIATALGTSPGQAELRYSPDSPAADCRWPYDYD